MPSTALVCVVQAMAADPTNFDAVFGHALAMQELATRATRQPAEALRLLTEVRLQPEPSLTRMHFSPFIVVYVQHLVRAELRTD